MKTKQFCVMLVALLMVISTLVPASAAVEVEGATYVGVSNMYLWRGFDLSNSNAVVQGGMDVSVKGLTLSYWSNLDLSSSEMNETDFTIDYGIALSDLVAIGVGNVFYALDNAADTNELYFGISLNTLLAPTLTTYFDYDQAQKDGLFLTFDITHDFELNKNLILSLGGLVSYNQKSDYSIGDYSAWHNYELNLTADYTLNQQISLSPYIIFSDALSHAADKKIKQETAGGINLTLNF
ncbi:MAG: TorF family putative porin [Geopsychrobacter sp.]|nr:TorF family putative porin [Geopsychrobacter sp.]